MKNTKITRGKIIALFSAVGILFGLGIAAFAWGENLQKSGADSTVYEPFFYLFMILNIVIVIVLLANLNKVFAYEAEKTLSKIDHTRPLVIDGVSETTVRNACAARRLYERDAIYYYRRIFSFTRDYINYFVKITNVSDIKDDIERETKLLGNQYPNKNKCLLLFLFTENVTDDDLARLKTCATSFILKEIPLSSGARYDTTVPVLVDRQTQKAYYICLDKLGAPIVSLYHHGTKTLKKLMQTK